MTWKQTAWKQSSWKQSSWKGMFNKIIERVSILKKMPARYSMFPLFKRK